MLIKKNNKSIILIFKNKFLKLKTNESVTTKKLITKDNLIFKTKNNNNFILKESE